MGKHACGTGNRHSHLRLNACCRRNILKMNKFFFLICKTCKADKLFLLVCCSMKFIIFRNVFLFKIFSNSIKTDLLFVNTAKLLQE